ncbi:hypothetical protein SmJEL517_g04092 [Synchytrium microbalum]|uniref:MYND-type domain-containing protein n=1 Tax=Synchytrium microbalum TaxID=1806994 RepID=A0A507C4G3_9FUNG|nr:uncharacterized protein SmJEL517_g04092 [Synchytrium microbalum]TPX32886.1 hypothetical protein SmJEL517_g04092 [Synchytrium microbalum]
MAATEAKMLERGNLVASEAESLIERLSRQSISDVGSSKWTRQHQDLERLNIQAHYNVLNQNEEFITEALITFDKIPTLIHELLVINLWKTKVLPLIANSLPKEHAVKLYFVMYHEAILVNLLEIVMYSKSSCLAAGDTILDVIDYCAKKFALLSTWTDSSDPMEGKTSTQDMLQVSEEEHHVAIARDLDYAIATSTMSIFRYLTDYITDLSLTAMTRILNTNDMICSCVSVMERAPWLRKTQQHGMQRFEDGKWKNVTVEDVSVLGKVEAQMWIALYNMLLEPECRKKYEYTTSRQSKILRLRDFITESLVDQLPVLVGLQRALEELSIMQPPDDPSVHRRGAMIEQVSELYDEIIKGVDWKKTAHAYKKHAMQETDASRMETAKSLASMYDLSELDALLDDPKCAKCGNPAEKRCSRCRHEWYCSRACQVKSWAGHKAICDILYKEVLHANEDGDEGEGQQQQLVSWSGINVAVQLQKIGFTNFTLYEKNPHLGGTWFENRYPGCACDVPSHLYNFSYERNPDWSSTYSSWDEILQYTIKVATKYNVIPFIKVNHKVIGATWNESTGTYRVEIDNNGTIVTDTCNALILGTGALNSPRIPDVPGADTFPVTLHTGRWDPNVKLEGKRVGVIGNGASGIQLIPQIVPKVGNLDFFMRTPPWILDYAISGKYTDEEKRKFREEPGVLDKYQEGLWNDLMKAWPLFLTGSRMQNRIRQRSLAKLEAEVKDPVLRKKLTPNFAVGCRRLTMSATFLSAVQQPNVSVITDTIERVTPEGIVLKTGELRKLDVLIYATGFVTDFKPRFPIIGRGGKSIAEEFADDAEGYLGVVTKTFPNMFFMMGVNAPWSFGSAPPAIEAVTMYVVQTIQFMMKNRVKSVEVKESVQRKWNDDALSFFPTTVWSLACGNWYKSKNGRFTAIWPGTWEEFIKAMEAPNINDFNIERWPQPASARL